MNVQDLTRANQVLDALRKLCNNLEIVRNTQEQATLTLHYKSKPHGYIEKFMAQNSRVIGIAKAYFEQSFQVQVNNYARELRGLGIEIPEELNKYVTDYPMRG